MEPEHISRALDGVTNRAGRRWAVVGLLAGAAATLSGNTGDAKKKRKKKKCQKPNLCQPRLCCVCAQPFQPEVPADCHYQPDGPDISTACGDSCEARGLKLLGGTHPGPGFTVFCTNNDICAVVECSDV